MWKPVLCALGISLQPIMNREPEIIIQLCDKSLLRLGPRFVHHSVERFASFNDRLRIP